MQRIDEGTNAWLLALVLLAAPAWSQPPQPTSQQQPQTAQSSYTAPVPRQIEPTPLSRVLQWCDIMLKQADRIDDYSCTFIKRERVGNQLGERQIMEVRIRHRPFSVHATTHSPSSLQGRQAVWVEGQNNGKMLAKATGLKAMLGTISLDPTGSLAMQGNRYPITEIGIRNLIEKMIRTTRQDAQVSDAEITFRRGAKVGDRACVCVQIEHPTAKSSLRYQMSRIYIDEQLFLPIHFEGYTWPEARGGEPVLVEQYTYTNLKLNHGYTDQDFSL